ncbi:MAG: hypothetical protein KTR31_27440 [Myxococcales bacterium]|nr:hypothetical protein [Myxococcales bacterium]
MEDETAITEVTSATVTSAIVATRQIGAFRGVFAPTLLAILGVIAYLRIGWVVGHAGLGGALLMLGLALMITVCTGLSLSSIASNTRVGDGGSFGVISRSLGFEVSSAIGVPLFLTRPLAAAMYIFGFREGLMWLASDLSPMAIDLVVFAVLFAVAYRGARLAYHLQTLVLLVIVASVVSIFVAGPTEDSPFEIMWWGGAFGASQPDSVSFWTVFAVFFPATTGFLAGAPTRVNLKDPRRTVPVGTMGAIALSALVYVGIAVWSARTGTPEALQHNYTHAIDVAFSPLLVVLGLLCASASSALAGLISGPRILHALGNNRIVPYSDTLADDVDGEPRNAMVLTGMLTLACLLFRDINVVAPLVTLLFLVTYAAINFALLVERQLSLVTFRPTVRVPTAVPVVGLVASVATLLVLSPLFGLASLGFMGGLAVTIRRVGQPSSSDETRSGMWVAAAEWAASRLQPDDYDNPRAWRPNLLVPVLDAEQLRDSYRLLMDLARPEGSIRLMGIGGDRRVEDLSRRLPRLQRSMRERKVRATWSIVDLDDYEAGLHVGALSMQGAFLRPNTMFLELGRGHGDRRRASIAMQIALERQLGVALYVPHPDVGLGESSTVRVWIRPGARPWDAAYALHRTNVHLALLLALRLTRSWGGKVELITFDPSGREDERAEGFLAALCDYTRFPGSAKHTVLVGDEMQAVAESSAADLSIHSFPDAGMDLDWALAVKTRTPGSCLFVYDSGSESATA